MTHNIVMRHLQLLQSRRTPEYFRGEGFETDAIKRPGFAKHGRRKVGEYRDCQTKQEREKKISAGCAS